MQCALLVPIYLRYLPITKPDNLLTSLGSAGEGASAVSGGGNRGQNHFPGFTSLPIHRFTVWCLFLISMALTNPSIPISRIHRQSRTFNIVFHFQIRNIFSQILIFGSLCWLFGSEFGSYQSPSDDYQQQSFYTPQCKKFSQRQINSTGDHRAKIYLVNTSYCQFGNTVFCRRTRIRIRKPVAN
jgi:hypothetical protein